MASNYPLYRITYTFAQNGNKKIPSSGYSFGSGYRSLFPGKRL